MAIWLPNSDVRLLDSVHKVFTGICRAHTLHNESEGQYQEWSVPFRYWHPCSDALRLLSAKVSPSPLDWLYKIIRSAGTPAANSGVAAQFIVDVPDPRALFKHYIGQELGQGSDGTTRWRANRPIVHVPALTGEVVSATIYDLGVDQASGRYSFAFDFGNGDRGSIAASTRGYVGSFSLLGHSYEISVLENGSQQLTIRSPVNIPDHPRSSPGGTVFDRREAAELASTAVADLESLSSKYPGRIDTAYRTRWSKTACPRPYKDPPPGTETRIKVLFAHTNDPQISKIASIDPDYEAPLDWDEVAAAIALGASDAFRRQGLATRVTSVGSTKLDFSEQYWVQALKKVDKRKWAGNIYPYGESLDLFRAVMLLAGMETPTEPDEAVLAVTVAADPKMSKEFADWKDLVRSKKYLMGADILAFIGGGPTRGTETFCGASGAIRATVGSAIISARLDCALLNDSFTHELGHLLGARHEKSYECLINHETGAREPEPRFRSDNECKEDDEDYGPCKHPHRRSDGELECEDDMQNTSVNPVSNEINLFRNRGYVDPNTHIATVMASGDASRATRLAVFAGNINGNNLRRPYWSSIQASGFDGALVSDGNCCDDGRIVDAYAATCVGENVPIAKSHADLTSLDLHELQETQTFELGIPRHAHAGELAKSPTESHEIRKKLIALAEHLRAQQINTIFVEGFGDAVGDDRVNDIISKRRAMTVAGIMCVGHPQAFIGTNFYGKRLPEIPQSDNTLEQRNRRVLISWPSSEQLHSSGAQISTESCERFESDYRTYQAGDM